MPPTADGSLHFTCRCHNPPGRPELSVLIAVEFLRHAPPRAVRSPNRLAGSSQHPARDRRPARRRRRCRRRRPGNDRADLTGLARGGTVFDARCAPRRCACRRAGSLMTGLLPSRTGAIDNAGELPASIPTFAHRLRLLGYRTVLTGKMHFVGPDQLHGFEERPMTDVYPAGLDWVPDWGCRTTSGCPGTTTCRASARRPGAGDAAAGLRRGGRVPGARAIVDTRATARPLLLVASFTHPHDPYEVPARLWDRYDDGAIPPPRHPATAGAVRSVAQRGCARWSMPTARRCPPSRSQPPGGATGRRSRWSTSTSGRCSTALDEQGLRDETVVVVTSDHGDMLGERGLWYKMAPFEPSIRVPLIVSGAGVGRGAGRGAGVAARPRADAGGARRRRRGRRRRPRRPQPRRRPARRSLPRARRRDRVPRRGRRGRRR